MTEFKNKNENIDRLLSKFFPPDQTEQIKTDFASADALFEKFPAPNPSPQTIAEIKQKIAAKLRTPNRISWTGVLVKTASVAAIIVIVSAVMLLNFNRKDSTQYAKDRQQTSLRQSEGTGPNTDIPTFEAELEQLKSELLAINLGEENTTNGTLVDQIEQLELEIIETENTFWKG
jgi:mannitol-specific phosphotransferase system IIBC component